MDLSKLSPAPWASVAQGWAFKEGRTGVYLICHGRSCLATCSSSESDADFIALARNAFDVMMRRGWSVYRDEWSHWRITYDGADTQSYADPFTALVEADRWHKEHVEHVDSRR